MLTISTKKGHFSWKWEMSENELLMETSRRTDTLIKPVGLCVLFCVSVSLCAAAVYSAES